MNAEKAPGVRGHAGRFLFALLVAALAGAVLAAFWASRRGGAAVDAAVLGGALALVCTALAMGSLALAERWTGHAATRRLLELSDPRSVLLARLASEAPGTWAHSVAMASLCEAACKAIGANGLLARVGCYYHDVGKLGNPRYFVENMGGGGPNPHAELTPQQSAELIRGHVEYGLALALEHGVPEMVRNFIPEHHGTQEISYFLERARESGGPLDPELFRYPGPLPQSAETAVALLADAVEAAVRVLEDPDTETLEDAIAHLVAGRIESGQLREAPLTLRQIDEIRRAFVRVLSAMYHSRLAYPEDQGGITADWDTAND